MALMNEIAIQEEEGEVLVWLDERTFAVATHGEPGEIARYLDAHGFGGLAARIRSVDEPSVAYLSGIMVAEEIRGRGVGTSLLRKLIARLRQLGIPELYLHAASPAAEDFFAREGFARMDCCPDDIFPVMGLSLEPRASLGAGDQPGPVEWQIVDMVRAMTDPVITMKPEWGVPDWLRERVHTDRMIQNLQAAKEGKRPDTATDAEALAYLLTASMEHPFDSDWVAIYLWVGWRVAGKKMEKGFGKPPEILTDYQKRLLDDLKRWLWTERLKVHKKRTKRPEIGDPRGPTVFEEHAQRQWRGIWVDAELKDEWLDRLNAVPDVEVRSTDVGGAEGTALGPSFSFHTELWEGSGEAPPGVREDFSSMVRDYFSGLGNVRAWWDGQRIAFLVYSPVHRSQMGKRYFNQWWEQAVIMLEALPQAVLLDASFAGAQGRGRDSF